MARLLPQMTAEIGTHQAQTNTYLKELKEQTKAELEARIEANFEKVEAL
jgi:hypothetical protein